MAPVVLSTDNPLAKPEAHTITYTDLDRDVTLDMIFTQEMNLTSTLTLEMSLTLEN